MFTLFRPYNSRWLSNNKVKPIPTTLGKHLKLGIAPIARQPETVNNNTLNTVVKLNYDELDDDGDGEGSKYILFSVLGPVYMWFIFRDRAEMGVGVSELFLEEISRFSEKNEWTKMCGEDTCIGLRFVGTVGKN